MERTYDVAADDPSIELLLRHRAMLFAPIAAGLIRGAFDRRLRAPAVTAAAITMGSYVALKRSISPTNDRLRQVERLDLAALAGLALAVVLDGNGRQG